MDKARLDNSVRQAQCAGVKSVWRAKIAAATRKKRTATRKGKQFAKHGLHKKGGKKK
jgi:hypothetical protein